MSGEWWPVGGKYLFYFWRDYIGVEAGAGERCHSAIRAMTSMPLMWRCCM